MRGKCKCKRESKCQWQRAERPKCRACNPRRKLYLSACAVLCSGSSPPVDTWRQIDVLRYRE